MSFDSEISCLCFTHFIELEANSVLYLKASSHSFKVILHVFFLASAILSYRRNKWLIKINTVKCNLMAQGI